MNFNSITKLIGITALSSWMVACQDERAPTDPPDPVVPAKTEYSLTELKEKTLRGDTSAYDLLQFKLIHGQPEDGLFWALHMAYQHDYPPALLDAYDCYKYIYEFLVPYDSLAIETRNVMDDLLRRAEARHVAGAAERRRERESNPDWWSGPLER